MKRGGKILLWILFGILVVALVTFLTQQLWNWLIPTLFSGPVINFWQMLGLLVLSKILLGGFGRGHHGGGHQWKMRAQKKFARLSPDERESIKQKMWEKWCRPYEERDPQKRSAEE